MASTLVVEDGTGMSNADSYFTLAEINTYATGRGLTFPITDEAKADAAVRRGTTWLDSTYGDRVNGNRKKGRAQALVWPRLGASDVYGEVIGESEIPAEWKRSAMEAAIREFASAGSLNPDVTIGKVKKSVAVEGAVSVTYADEGGVVASQQPVITLIDGLLKPLLTDTTSGRTTTKFLLRA